MQNDFVKEGGSLLEFFPKRIRPDFDTSADFFSLGGRCGKIG